MRTTKRIKLFVDNDLEELQNYVNEFIASVKDIVDVKLTETVHGYTILVIYIK